MFRVLIIDDEKVILDMLSMAMSKYGFTVQTAASGGEGIKKFDNDSFDLVITDIRMPGVDGNAVGKHIRGSEKRFTPIIGISGTPWLPEKSVFDTILPKPFHLKQLAVTAQNLISSQVRASA